MSKSKSALNRKPLHLDPNCQYGKLAVAQFRRACPDTPFRFMEMKGDGNVTFHLHGDDPDRFSVDALYLVLSAKDAEIERLRGVLELAAKQLEKTHKDAFKQAAGYGLVTTDGREFSCAELNECETVASILRVALSPISDAGGKP